MATILSTRFRGGYDEASCRQHPPVFYFAVFAVFGLHGGNKSSRIVFIEAKLADDISVDPSNKYGEGKVQTFSGLL